MKKLLLLLVGVFVALSANAADPIYLCGSNASAGWTSNPSTNNWDPTNPIPVSESDGYYKFTAKGQFKTSTKKSDSGWGTFQANALAVDNNASNSCKWVADGTNYKATMAHQEWSANNVPPSAWGEDVVIYYRIKNNNGTYTIEATKTLSDWESTGTDWSKVNLYLRGFGDWDNPAEDKKLTYSNGVFTSGELNIASDTEFKIGSSEKNSWTYAWGPSDVTISGTDNLGNSNGNFKTTAALTKVTFTFNPSATPKPTLVVSEGTGTPDPDPAPEGTKYYVMGGYTEVEDTPMLLVPDTEGRYQTTIKCYDKDGWSTLILFSEDADGNRTYYGATASAGAITAGRSFDVALSETRINVSNLDKEKTYVITFSPGGKNVTISEDTRDRGTYYLSGDINVWSDVEDRNAESTTESQKYGYFVKEKDSDKYFYMQDDPNNPWVRFKSKDEMENKWKFEFVDFPPEGYDNVDGRGWYRLNLMARGSSDLNKHVGRLGGQFKIITKDLTATSTGFGVDGGADQTYWNKEIEVGQVFTGGKSGGKQNFLIKPTVIENAVIWFQPSTSKVLILGDPKDLYVYYANNNYTGTTGPATYVQDPDQYNNYAQVLNFKNGKLQDNGNSFEWKEYFGEDVDGDGELDGVDYWPYGEGVGEPVHFTSVWRKKIPASIVHRTPMSFITSVKPAAAGDNDEWFPRVRIECEDIWFVENSANVYFRFADPNVQDADMTKVYFNAWLDQYDAAGNLAKPKFLYSGFKGHEMTKITSANTELWNAIPLRQRTDAAGNEVSWFKAPTTLEADFANAGHAMFATSYGGEYPTNLQNASVGDRQSVALNGADLFYVVGGSSSRVGILYSHLKGTFAKGDADVIQIGAEFFAKGHSVYKDNDLNTTIGSEVDYQFSVVGPDKSQCLADPEEWKDEPYCDWNVDGLPAGLYTVTVTVRKLVDGIYEYYSSNDIYPIFSSH